MQAGTDHKQAISDPTAPELTVDGVVATVRFRKPALANSLSPDDLATLRNHIDTVNREKGVLVLRRSAESRVGKECVSQCSSRWSPDHEKQQNTMPGQISKKK